MQPNRTIVEDTHFRRELLAIEPNEEDADNLIEGATFVLSREPTLGRQNSSHSPLWYLTILLPPDREAVLYYTFDATEVLLISIQIQ